MRALYAVENGYILNRPSRRRRRMRGGEGRSRNRARSPKRWVQDATSSLKHEGSLHRKAQRSHMSTQSFACSVLRSPSRHTLQTQRQAQFFVNINKKNTC